MIDHINIAIIGLYKEGDRSAALAKLRKDDGELIPVGGIIGSDPWGTLAELLNDIKPVLAWECLIFSNAGLDFRKDTVPPSDILWTRIRGQYGEPQYIIRKDLDKVSDPSNLVRFAALRLLFRYDKYRYVEVTADSLSSTRELLQRGCYSEKYN